MENYTPRQVADILRITRTTVYKLIASKRIRASDISTGQRKIWRIKKKDLDKFMEVK